MRYQESFTKTRQMILGIILLTLVAAGSSLAAKLNINSGKPSEFSQGVYQIAACDDWIYINMGQSAAIYDGLSRVNSFVIEGLDPFACKGAAFEIQAYKTGDLDGSPRPLFIDQTNSEGVTSVSLLIDSAGSVQLQNQSGAPIGLGDASHQLSYNSTTGTFTVSFESNPVTIVGDINYLKISSNPLNS